MERGPKDAALKDEITRDHRLAMTAMALASKCGGEISESEICEVSDPGFIPRLLGLGD